MVFKINIYDKRDDFDFDIVNFLFLEGDIPRSTSYVVYISQLIRFARVSNYVADFNTRNQLLQLCTARTDWSDSVIRSETSFITESYRIGPTRSDSVIKLVSVLFGKCTTLVITKC